MKKTTLNEGLKKGQSKPDTTQKRPKPPRPMPKPKNKK